MNVVQANLKWSGQLIPLKLSDVKYIVIHHLEHPTATVQDVHEWHLKNSWSGFGYSEMIDKNGIVYIGRGYNQGAHTLNWNSQSLGIALQGDYEKETKVSEKQYQSLLERVRFHLEKLPKDVQIVGHCELNNTKCPGQYFMPYLEKLKKEAYIKGGNVLNNNDVVSDWAKDAQKFVIDNKISDGTRPKDNVTREELWTVINNLVKLFKSDSV